MQQNLIPSKSTLNPERFAKSLERLSIYEGNTKNRLLQAAQKIDVEKMIGTLDLDSIDAQMSFNKHHSPSI